MKNIRTIHAIVISALLYFPVAVFANAADETFTTAMSLYELDMDRSALQLLLKLAETGHAGAQYQVGLMYSRGEGVERKNMNEAVKWYEKSAENGYLLAQLILGATYQHGKGIERDQNKSFKWYLRAAEHGNADAQHNVAIMYHHGIGVAQNYEKAHDWYLKAAQQGQAMSQFNLALMYANGQVLMRDNITGYAWIYIASIHAHVEAKSIWQKLENDPYKDELRFALYQEKAQELIEQYHLL